jgi:PAS domain S-box-containing protein
MDCIGIEGQLALFNGSPVIVYTCEPAGDFATTFVSPGVSAQLGWAPSDFLNDPAFWASHIHPDDKGRAIGGIYNLFENDRYSREYRFLHKDGSYRWMSDSLQLERDSSGEPARIVGYWMDVSTQKQAKQALSDSETRYRQMAELSPDGMFVHVDGKIVFANAKLAQILAVSSPADLFGISAIELIAP